MRRKVERSRWHDDVFGALRFSVLGLLAWLGRVVCAFRGSCVAVARSGVRVVRAGWCMFDGREGVLRRLVVRPPGGALSVVSGWSACGARVCVLRRSGADAVRHVGALGAGRLVVGVTA